MIGAISSKVGFDLMVMLFSGVSEVQAIIINENKKQKE
jgi:hypothetical protein